VVDCLNTLAQLAEVIDPKFALPTLPSDKQEWPANEIDEATKYVDRCVTRFAPTTKRELALSQPRGSIIKETINLAVEAAKKSEDVKKRTLYIM